VHPNVSMLEVFDVNLQMSTATFSGGSSLHILYTNYSVRFVAVLFIWMCLFDHLCHL